VKALAAALAGVPGLGAVAPADLRPLPDKGVAHDHVLIGATGLMARVPRPTQFGPAAGDAYIRYQVESFRRASPSLHVPRLIAALAPAPGLPLGALVIEAVAGRPPRLPEDLPRIAEALARIHSLPVPPAAKRPPLQDHADPARGTLEVIERNARSLAAACADPGARAAIEQEIAWARSFAADSAGKDQPVTLAMSDTHPGNFLIDAKGRAMFVDVEKAVYGSPAIDLAHATLYTSTVWDPDCGAVLNPDDVRGFYRGYLARIDPGLAQRLKPWLGPMRRLTWLRTTTWACRFKTEVIDRGLAGDPASRYARHARECIQDYLSPATVARLRAEWLGPAPFDPA
jgi:aminoglycoside phosphotransferase (APT) family kinase protein